MAAVLLSRWTALATCLLAVTSAFGWRRELNPRPSIANTRSTFNPAQYPRASNAMAIRHRGRGLTTGLIYAQRTGARKLAWTGGPIEWSGFRGKTLIAKIYKSYDGYYVYDQRETREGLGKVVRGPLQSFEQAIETAERLTSAALSDSQYHMPAGRTNV